MLEKQVDSFAEVARDHVCTMTDDAAYGDELRRILSFLGYRVTSADSSNWRQVLAETDAAAVVLAPGISEAVCDRIQTSADQRGMGLVRLRAADDRRAVAGVDDARFVSAQYPLRNPDFSRVIERAVAGGRRPGNDASAEDAVKALLIGGSLAVRQARSLILRVAPTDATVLIQGETGTGKELAARAVWAASKRKDKPFVALNCGAIPPDLLESELFGHEKGAFTGAISARQGRFELAHGGTLFLDEIGDMPMPMQVKLLRVLQERRFERVGSTRSIDTDVRIIAATHRDLEQAIEQGAFRSDLFYRLHVFPIEMAPLRQRPEDIPALVQELLQRLHKEGRETARFSTAAMQVLTNNRWPGNVRELGNLIERLSIMHPDQAVDVPDLPGKLLLESDSELVVPLTQAMQTEPVSASLPPDGVDLREHLSSIEERLIREALTEAHGVVAQAAKLLRLQRTTLVEKLRKYEIDRESIAP